MRSNVNNRTALAPLFLSFFILSLVLRAPLCLFSLFLCDLIVVLHDAPLNNNHGLRHMRQTGFKVSLGRPNSKKVLSPLSRARHVK